MYYPSTNPCINITRNTYILGSCFMMMATFQCLASRLSLQPDFRDRRHGADDPRRGINVRRHGARGAAIGDCTMTIYHSMVVSSEQLHLYEDDFILMGMLFCVDFVCLFLLAAMYFENDFQGAVQIL
ncbi:hypothetical protein ACLKA7_001097 [Drosophila subpalustris]